MTIIPLIMKGYRVISTLDVFRGGALNRYTQSMAMERNRTVCAARQPTLSIYYLLLCPRVVLEIKALPPGCLLRHTTHPSTLVRWSTWASARHAQHHQRIALRHPSTLNIDTTVQMAYNVGNRNAYAE
jgi:hypothetical protein